MSNLEFREHAQREPTDAAFTSADWAVLDRLQEIRGPILVERATAGARVSTFSWIGTIPLEVGDLRIRPKLVGDDLAVLTMLGYANGHDAHRTVRKLLGTMMLPPRGPALVDLIGTMLASECEALIQQGLIQRFVEREAGLPYVRGRLLVLDQVRRHPGQITTLECRYEDFDGDVLENQWLAAALERAVVACRTEEVRRRLRVCRAVFSEICDTSRFDVALTDQFDYQRDNTHYRDAHDWGNLFLRPERLGRLFAAGPRSFAFLMDMDKVFEQFIARLVTNALAPAGVGVDRQRGDHAVIRWADSGEDYQRIVPDLLLTMAVGRTLPVDSKYKLYGDRKIDSGDVYQLFTYAFAYAAPGSAPAAILIFPVEGDAYERGSLEIRSHDATMRAAFIETMGVPVQALLGLLERGEEPAALRELREQLMGAWQSIGQPDTDSEVSRMSSTTRFGDDSGHWCS